jgi:hypothetical protein
MPNIDNLETKTNNRRDNLLNVRRGEILYREDLRTGFTYALSGLAIALAIAGGIYVIGKQLLK